MATGLKMKIKKKQTGEIGKKRRRIIISAALKIFAEFGYKGATVQKIADSAGVPKTSVLYYFSSKKSIYSAVMQSILNKWNSSFDSVTEDDCPAQSIAQYIAEKMELSRLHPYSSKAFAIEVINGSHNLDSSFKEAHTRWVQGRIKIINAWITSGKMAPINPEFLIYSIWSNTQHYADFSSQITSLRGSELTEDEYREATTTIMKLILKGCGLEIPKEYINN